MTVLHCHYCGTELDPNGDHYRQIVGWEKPGRGQHDRSGSSLVLREHVPDVAACLPCIAAIRAGIDVRQASLL